MTPKAKPSEATAKRSWIEAATERCETYAKIERMSREERESAKLKYDEWYLPEAMLSIQQTAAESDLPRALQLPKRCLPWIDRIQTDHMYEGKNTDELDALLEEIES